MALKIERKLGLEEGTLVILQAYYDIEKVKEKDSKKIPDLSIMSKSLFWDTDVKLIDWEQQYLVVIERIFERGNESDKKENTRFYGAEKVRQAVEESNARSPYTVHKANKIRD